jgi:hypothetical protein
MGPKGYVLIKKEFVATKMWPDPKICLTPPCIINMEKAYKEALSGKVALVMDISVTDDGYLVYAESKEAGPFIWMIEKEDTVDGSFLPVIWKYGHLIPAGMNAAEEFAYLAKNMANSVDYTKTK